MIGESHVARLITAMKDEKRGMEGEKRGMEREAVQATAGTRQAWPDGGQEKGHSEEWPKSLILMVGARRFELPTPCTPCMYATRLRYAPTR